MEALAQIVEHGLELSLRDLCIAVVIPEGAVCDAVDSITVPASELILHLGVLQPGDRPLAELHVVMHDFALFIGDNAIAVEVAYCIISAWLRMEHALCIHRR